MILRFGDIVENGWAGEGNPYKIGIVVKSGKVISCTDGKGHFWLFDNDKRLKLTKVGALDMTPYNKSLNDQLITG